jgi:hypothetical protein
VSNQTTRLVTTLAVSSLLVLSACSGNGDGGSSPSATTSAGGSGSPTPSMSSAKIYDGNGITFRYPKAWKELTLTDTTASSGRQLWNETVGIDGTNFVAVSGYTINIPITAGNIDEQKDIIGGQIATLFERAGGSLEDGPTDETLGGLPAIGFTGTALNPSGESVTSRLVLAFDHLTEYFVNCQYDSSTETALLAGCDQILSTFSIG